MSGYSRRSTFYLVLITIALTVPDSVRAFAKSDTNQRLMSVIKKVKRERTPAARLTTAEELVSITDGHDCADITDQTLLALVSLLDLDDDGVRMWTAASLGDIGPRANIAVPKLLSILAGNNCKSWDHSSAATIPIALRRIGVEPPLRNCKF
jgi:hypothetical protein